MWRHWRQMTCLQDCLLWHKERTAAPTAYNHNCNKTHNNSKMNPIKRIVLTGGPCAGKTTALVRVTEYFSNLGYKVFTVPEVPTMITQSGWSYLTDNKDFYYEGELVILQTQLALEDSIMRLAETVKKDQPCVVICDRGTMDISAYISPEMWQELTSRVGYTSEELCKRYDAVLHLVTAADGAEQFYTTANNAQRYEQANEEGLKIARCLDRKVLEAWANHPHFRVIDNAFDFDCKLNRVLKEISQTLELPLPVTEEFKFIVETTGEIPDATESEITQTYLVADPDCEVRLRRRRIYGQTLNILTTTRTLSDRKRIITERQVTNQVYESLMQQADPYRQTINKERRSFIWQGHFYELDTYTSPHEGLMVLEAKGVSSRDDIVMPPFIKVIEDITGNRAYYNYNIALRR